MFYFTIKWKLHEILNYLLMWQQNSNVRKYIVLLFASYSIQDLIVTMCSLYFLGFIIWYTKLSMYKLKTSVKHNLYLNKYFICLYSESVLSAVQSTTRKIIFIDSVKITVGTPVWKLCKLIRKNYLIHHLFIILFYICLTCNSI